MAKLNIEEFNNKYSERITDNDDLLIELMEDFSDSVENDNIEELEKLRNEIEQHKEEIKILKQKYKERFLNIISDDIKEKENEKDDFIEEKEIIDIKEI